MAFESLAVANKILKEANDRRVQLTPLQLQKLVYFAHGWCLGLFDRPLINEQVEAWPYGPVIPTVYHAFKKYGDDPILARARRSVRVGDGQALLTVWDTAESNDPALESIANAITKKIVDNYGSRSGLELSSMTHAPGTPWRAINDEYGGNIPKGTDIPELSIKRYFQTISAD